MGLLRLLLCGLAIFLGSCSAPEPPLRVGLLLWPPYELTVLAQDKGWYPDDSVRILEYQSPIHLSRAFRSGQVDVALTTSHIALALADDGIDYRIVYVVDHSRGGDALVARPGIASLEDLAGKAVGVEPSPLGMYVLGRVLSQAGLDRQAITVVPMDIPRQRSAYANGRVDAVVTYEPVRTHLLEDGARELFNSREIPREIIDVVIARASVTREQADRLAMLVDGMDRALAHLREFPEDALPRMVSRMAIETEEFRLALDGAHLLDMAENRQWMTGESSPLVEALDKQMRHMKAMGMIKGTVDIPALIDPRYLRPGDEP